MLAECMSGFGAGFIVVIRGLVTAVEVGWLAMIRG